MNLRSLDVYPESRAERDRWIEARRGPKNNVDPVAPYDFFNEEEVTASGEVAPVATILLTNSECPWRCLMCDLWKNTLTGATPAGATIAQIDHALMRLRPARQIKLYNSGSFFDQRTVPRREYPEIACRLAGFERIIVESHPALIGDACFEFDDLLDHGRLEVAMGLETANPDILAKLNKQMTLELFAESAAKLKGHGIGLRVFLLVKPPFMQEHDALYWTERSIDVALECGATAVTLIPTRSGNGALDELAVRDEFSPPDLAVTESAFSYGLSLRRGRIFVDLWDLGRNAQCLLCHDRRVERLRSMNLLQACADRVECVRCGRSR